MAHARSERLEVGIPDPRDVAAVGDPIVEHAEDVVHPVLRAEQSQHLVGARRVLDQQDRQLAVAERDALAAAEHRGGRPEAAGDGRRVDLERARESRGGERVVDVVEARQ